MGTQTKKNRVRFTGENDLDLLRLVLMKNPFEDTARWTNIQQTIAGITSKQFSLRTVKEHVQHLIQLYLKEDKTNIKKTGTEEEYEEKLRLLQKVNDLKQEYSNCSEINRQRESELEILCDKTLKNCPGGISFNQELLTNVDSIELVHETRKEITATSSPGSSIIVPVLGSSHPRRKKINVCNNPALHYLKRKVAVDAEFREKRLRLEERKVAAEERKITLQEKMFEQQCEDRAKRTEADSKERAVYLKIMEQQQQLVSLFLQHFQQKIS